MARLVRSRSPLLGVGAAALFAGCGNAPADGIVDFVKRDEIEGKTTFHVEIHATSYEANTNEDRISLKCSPNGEIEADWFRGSRDNGKWGNLGMTLPVTYKFDDQAPETWFAFEGITLNEYKEAFDRKYVWSRGFTKKLAASRVLDAKRGVEESTTRFMLDGAAEALDKGFSEQCHLFDTP